MKLVVNFSLLLAFTPISETYLLHSWIWGLSTKFQRDLVPVWMQTLVGQNINFVILDLDVYHGLLLLLYLLNDAKLVEIFLIFIAWHLHATLFWRIQATVLNRRNLSRLNDSSLFLLLSLSYFFLETQLWYLFLLFLGCLRYGAWPPSIFEGWGRISHAPNWIF